MIVIIGQKGPKFEWKSHHEEALQFLSGILIAHVTTWLAIGSTVWGTLLGSYADQAGMVDKRSIFFCPSYPVKVPERIAFLPREAWGDGVISLTPSSQVSSKGKRERGQAERVRTRRERTAEASDIEVGEKALPIISTWLGFVQISNYSLGSSCQCPRSKKWSFAYPGLWHLFRFLADPLTCELWTQNSELRSAALLRW